MITTRCLTATRMGCTSPLVHLTHGISPHIIIAGVGPTLCNCQASNVTGDSAYQLYENDSPQNYSIVDSYLSTKRRIPSTTPRHVRDLTLSKAQA